MDAQMEYDYLTAAPTATSQPVQLYRQIQKIAVCKRPLVLQVRFDMLAAKREGAGSKERELG
jgi:hypothetical protein